MFYGFRYEEEFLPTLSRLPLHVRMKLDLAGIKLSLNDWLAFAIEERRVLCHLPVDGADEKRAFSSYMDFLCEKYRGTPVKRVPPPSDPAWNDPNRVPSQVLERTAAEGKAVTLEQWQGWDICQRYALYKTAVSKNEPEKFFAVLEELRRGKS